MLRRLRLVALVAVCGLLVAPAWAESEREPFSEWLQALRAEAISKGVSTETLDEALAGVRPIERVIELDRRQPEFTQTFWQYLERRVTPGRIERGRRMLREHHALLERVEDRYDVQPRFLVAFWGMETDFGRHLGRFPVIGSLATLAYDERRSAFFRAQLLDALTIVDRDDIEPERMRGSWAGAMGHLQFLPSTYLRYAVDANGDERRDLWSTLPDVFASGAHYLSEMGWHGDQIWGREVRLPQGFDWSQARLAVKKPLDAWAAAGVRRADGRPLPDAEMRGAIVLPQGHEGPAFLVYENFEVILGWNRSVNYAVAVGHLADRLIGLPRLRTGRDADSRPLSRAQAEELQRQLNAHGFDAGAPDGIPGPQTRSAVRAYQQAVGLPADGYPSVALLERLRDAANGRPPRTAN